MDSPTSLKGDAEKGIRALKKSQTEFPGSSSLSSGLLGYALAKAGRENEARKLLKELWDLEQKSHKTATTYAFIYVGLGETDKGFDWLDKAADAHESVILHIPVDPFADSIRSHPRYKALLRKMNLEA